MPSPEGAKYEFETLLSGRGKRRRRKNGAYLLFRRHPNDTAFPGLPLAFHEIGDAVLIPLTSGPCHLETILQNVAIRPREVALPTDLDVLLVLLVVRVFGGHGVPAKDEVFKGLTKGLDKAKAANLIAESDGTVTITTKTGRASKKTVKVLGLTVAGERQLLQGDAQTLAAAEAAGRASLVKALEADRRELLTELRGAINKPAAAKNVDPTKELAGFAKDLQKLCDRLTKLEVSVQAGPGVDVQLSIERGFSALMAKVDKAYPAPITSSGTAASVNTPQPKVTDVLRAAYRTLRQFVEYDDGLIPLPALFHESRRTLPHLSVADFHRELETLWDQRKLELKILNEVRKATERDKAIQRGDNLYYYVYWSQP